MAREMIITSKGKAKVSAQFDGLTLDTDQKEKYGGEGSAPEPFNLFLASIGTCAGFFVFAFCQKRNIPTDNIRIRQTHHRRETGSGLEKISLSIEVPPDFPEKYKQALIKAADLCPVKKQIQDAPAFEVTTETIT